MEESDRMGELDEEVDIAFIGRLVPGGRTKECKGDDAESLVKLEPVFVQGSKYFGTLHCIRDIVHNAGVALTL